MAQAKALATKTNDLGMLLWDVVGCSRSCLAENARRRAAVAERQGLLDEMAENERTIAALLDQVVQLDISEELTTLRRPQKEIAELQLQAIALQKDLLEEIETLYKAGYPSRGPRKLFMRQNAQAPTTRWRISRRSGAPR